MGDIALRGNKLTKGRGPHGHGPKPFLNRPGQAQGTHGGKAKGGRIGKFGGGRTNLLEELGRVEAERSNPNRRAEISRVHGELNRGYAKGGRIGYKHSGLVGKLTGGKKSWDKADIRDARIARELAKRGKKSKTVFSDTGKSHGKGHRLHTEKGKQMFGVDKKAEGGRVGLKHGGKPWGTGPKPGTIEFFQSTTQTPKRKRKAVGGVARGAQKAADTFTEKVGGSEKGKPHSTKEGRIASGKRKISRFLQSRALKKEAGPQAPSRPKRTWPPKHKDLMRRFPKRNPHRDVADIIKDRTVPNPRRKPGEKKEYQPAATGGRMGFKKGTDKKWMQKVSASIKKRGTKGKCTPITKPGCTGRAKALAKTFKKIAAKNKKA